MPGRSGRRISLANLSRNLNLDGSADKPPPRRQSRGGKPPTLPEKKDTAPSTLLSLIPKREHSSSLTEHANLGSLCPALLNPLFSQHRSPSSVQEGSVIANPVTTENTAPAGYLFCMMGT
eukprot:sb/3476189/